MQHAVPKMGTAVHVLSSAVVLLHPSAPHVNWPVKQADGLQSVTQDLHRLQALSATHELQQLASVMHCAAAAVLTGCCRSMLRDSSLFL